MAKGKYLPHGHKENSSRENWADLGFLKEEAYWMSEMSTKGANDSPAVMMMRRHRRGIIANTARYSWTYDKYLNAIVRDYGRCGMPKFHAWNSEQAKLAYIDKHYYDYLGHWKDEYNQIDPNWKGSDKPKTNYKTVAKSQKTQKEDAQAKVRSIEKRLQKNIPDKERNKLEKDLAFYRWRAK
jgi:hypothetical protein